MPKILCIYHANCTDGFTAAYVVKMALGSDVEFHPASYGTSPPDIKNRHVIIVDFSYRREVLLKMAEEALSIVVLDHHKTAEEDLIGLPAAVEEPICMGYQPDDITRLHQEEGIIPIRVLFDMGRSGAQIANNFFFGKNFNRFPIVDYVGDRDLWKFELPNSKAINAYIQSFPQTFENWSMTSEQMLSYTKLIDIAEIGISINRKHLMDVKEVVKASQRTMVIGGYTILVANVPFTMASDAGNILATGCPFAATYIDTPNGRMFSLRSAEDGVDVSEIAKLYGGGGHKHAAGFKRPIGWEGEGTPS